MREVLLCTVGKSLLGNLRRMTERGIVAPGNIPMEEAYQSRRWSDVAKGLLQMNPDERECGAEINALEQLIQKRGFSFRNIVFFVSETEVGEGVGNVLKSYVEQRRDLDVAAELVVIEDLQDGDPIRFKVHGLRNLVREFGSYIERFGRERVVIDATGGYKAQAAIAVMMGQVLDIPVFYKHEYFSEIIDFPPLPISFDYEILARNSDLLTDFERGAFKLGSEIGPVEEAIRSLLVEVQEGEESLYELGAFGQIYLESFRIRYPKPINLRPSTNRKVPTYGADHHYPKNFSDFVNRVWSENDWIHTANTVPYGKQRAIKGIGFHVRKEDEQFQLIGTYQDGNKFGARFRLRLTDESFSALTWAADYLNQRYRDGDRIDTLPDSLSSFGSA